MVRLLRPSFALSFPLPGPDSFTRWSGCARAECAISCPRRWWRKTRLGIDRPLGISVAKIMKLVSSCFVKVWCRPRPPTLPSHCAQELRTRTDGMSEDDKTFWPWPRAASSTKFPTDSRVVGDGERHTSHITRPRSAYCRPA